MRLGVRAALVDGEVVPGDVEVRDRRIGAVGVAPPARGGLAIPGYIDLQVNGFAGVDFLEADAGGYARAGEALAATGVTAIQPTLVSSPEGATVTALGAVRRARDEGIGPRVLGAHLEGPFVSSRWPGAHDTDHLVPPDRRLTERLCEAGPVTTLTLAPELPGAFDVIDDLVARAVVVSLGHTDADAATAHAAFDRGARAMTHLFNAHRPFHARDPGVGGAAMARPEITVGVIADLVHVASEALLVAWNAARGRVALVTDATAAAAAPPGRYVLGSRELRSDGRAVRLPDGTLAGSALTLDRAVRNLMSLGIPVVDAVTAASTIPARLIGRPELGTLRPGTPADLAVLDDEGGVTRTIVAGIERFPT